MSISRPDSSRTITAVIVTFNRKNKLRCCIESVLKQTARCDVVIVDNGSTDGTESLVRAYDNPRIRYYNTGANLGGAGGFHFGIKAAAKAGYDYIWLRPTLHIMKDSFRMTNLMARFWFLSCANKMAWKASKATTDAIMRINSGCVS